MAGWLVIEIGPLQSSAEKVHTMQACANKSPCNPNHRVLQYKYHVVAYNFQLPPRVDTNITSPGLRAPARSRMPTDPTLDVTTCRPLQPGCPPRTARRAWSRRPRQSTSQPGPRLSWVCPGRSSRLVTNRWSRQSCKQNPWIPI